MSENLTQSFSDHFSRTIAIDVDNTLIRRGVINYPLIEWLRERRQHGSNLMLWSMRGRAYATQISADLKCPELFHVIASKPGYVVDDQGWNWIAESQIIDPRSI